MRNVLTIVLCSLVVACGGSDNATSPKATVGGTWRGVVDGQTLSLTLIENAGSVSGTGTITNTPTGTRALTVTGTFVNAAFTATMSSGTLQPIALQATVAGSSMTGNLTGSGFTGEAITLTRQ
jgi:hypothetical protein